MDVEQQLAQNITSESKAYGYTLSIWGSGSILSHVYGSPTIVQILLYVVGALVAFSVVLILTFDQLIVDESIGSQIPVPSMLHLIGTLGTLIVGVLLARAVSVTPLSSRVGFALVGFQVTFMYNILLPVETGFVRLIIRSQHESEG